MKLLNLFKRTKKAEAASPAAAPEQSSCAQTETTTVPVQATPPTAETEKLLTILSGLEKTSEKRTALTGLIHACFKDLAPSVENWDSLDHNAKLAKCFAAGAGSLEADPVFSSLPQEIPRGDRSAFTDEYTWLLLKDDSMLSCALLALICTKHRHINLRLPASEYGSCTLYIDLKEIVQALKGIKDIEIISLLEIQPTHRLYLNLLNDKCYKDYLKEGYGAVDDAETVWFRFQHETEIPPELL